MVMDRVSGRAWAARLFGASPARTLALLQAAWPLAVGPELARRTEVVGVEKGTLRVRVPDAGWRKVLHRIQPQILSRLREIAGDALAPRRMGFLEGALSADSESGVERRAAAVDEHPTLPASLARAVSAIPDPEIRARFAAAAARYLARSKGATDA
jgi:hypothetical protein